MITGGTRTTEIERRYDYPNKKIELTKMSGGDSWFNGFTKLGYLSNDHATVMKVTSVDSAY